MEKREAERILNLSSELGEHFKDYLIVVRVKDGLMFRMSDRSWALGAMRFIMDEMENGMDDMRGAMEFEADDWV